MPSNYRDAYLQSVLNNDSFMSFGQNPTLDVNAWLAAGRNTGGGGGANLVGSAHPNPTPYGQVPNVPNPAVTSRSAIDANAANMAALKALYDQLNTFNAGQAKQQYQMNFPNYDALTQQRSDIIGQQFSGQLNRDVIDQIVQQAAERGIMTGSPGSANTNSAYLRALGLTSRDEQQRGMQNYAQAYAQTPTAPISDPSRMFITPDAVQQAQMAANLYASAPDPALAAAEARRYGGVSTPSYGGMSSGGGGGYGAPRTAPSTSYYGSGGFPGDVALSGGGGYNYLDESRYDSWSNWYNNGGNSDMTGNQTRDSQGWDWGQWEDDWYNADNPEPEWRYDPIIDVSVNPNMLSGGSSWYDFAGFDPGF